MHFLSNCIVTLFKIPNKNLKIYKIFIFFLLIRLLSYLRNLNIKKLILNIPYIKEKIKTKLKLKY